MGLANIPADRPHPDNPAATVSVSVACETGRCDRCRGKVVSLLVPVGTRCEHLCHQEKAPA